MTLGYVLRHGRLEFQSVCPSFLLSAYLSAHLSTWNNSALTEQIFMRLDI